MNIEPLRRRLERLREQLPRPEARERLDFAFHLFMPQERARLQRFLSQIEPKYRYHASGRLHFGELARDEFDELGLWLYLEDALKSQDSHAVARYRRQLNTSLGELIALFLAIDLDQYDSGPINSNPIGATKDRYGRSYKLYKSDHRYIKINVIENAFHRARIQRYEIEQMWQWVEWYEQEQRKCLV